MSDPLPMSINPGIYRHTKSGKLYEVLGVALHSETSEQVVIYKPKYDSPYEYFVRPYAMFIEKVEIDNHLVSRFIAIHR